MYMYVYHNYEWFEWINKLKWFFFNFRWRSTGELIPILISTYHVKSVHKLVFKVHLLFKLFNIDSLQLCCSGVLNIVECHVDLHVMERVDWNSLKMCAIVHSLSSCHTCMWNSRGFFLAALHRVKKIRV